MSSQQVRVSGNSGRLTDTSVPAPVSLTRACRWFVRSQVATGSKVSAILSVTQVLWSPELSMSRYLCKSKTRSVVELSGFVTVAIVAPHPLLMNVPALEKFVPGKRIMCETVSAFRIASTAA